MGKTTCAAAHAVARAERGARVLVVSADPAHSLGDALDLPLRHAPRAVKVRRGTLHASELDAAAALERWLSERRTTIRLIAERGTYLDREDIDRFLDLSLPGVDELVALLEVRRLAASGRYDEVVLDTAPTGHLLRLLQTPRTLRSIAGVLGEMQEKHRVVAESLGGEASRPRRCAPVHARRRSAACHHSGTSPRSRHHSRVRTAVSACAPDTAQNPQSALAARV